jgi:hypothetical protein
MGIVKPHARDTGSSRFLLIMCCLCRFVYHGYSVMQKLADDFFGQRWFRWRDNLCVCRRYPRSPTESTRNKSNELEFSLCVIHVGASVPPSLRLFRKNLLMGESVILHDHACRLNPGHLAPLQSEREPSDHQAFFDVFPDPLNLV